MCISARIHSSNEIPTVTPMFPWLATRIDYWEYCPDIPEVHGK